MILPDLSVEKSLWEKGLNYIAGIDEVGRGSWAGPMVAAGVIFEKYAKILKGLADSKQLIAKERERLAAEIKKAAVSYFVAEIGNRKIAKIGLSKATNELFLKVAKNLTPQPDFCIIDAFYIKYFAKKKQLAIKGGDAKCATIAAASIVAKVYRDELMLRFHYKYPNYRFDAHKGYGTKKHQEAIKTYGFSQIHRTSYNLSFLFK